jgi:hypothetical protein
MVDRKFEKLKRQEVSQLIKKSITFSEDQVETILRRTSAFVAASMNKCR